ncbi:MAG TPA: hypothetical protein VJ835_02080 [Fimbriimonadaceae bacterium]|nr:hypothetical protein [Fimbriimonadaceae bacterium]
MIVTALVAALSTVWVAPISDEVKLARVYKLGEKTTYQIKSNMSIQHRSRGLETWIPEDLDLNYQFTTEVKALKPDGVADVLYLRPTMTIITGETFDNPPKTEVEKVKYNMLLTLSPANEVLNMKDLNPPPKAAGKKGGGNLKFHTVNIHGQSVQIPFIGQFIGEVHRLALFAGNFESALDFAPRLPFENLKVGDTWKRTVGYSPQKLKGKDGKTVNQRLDYTFTYKGLVDSGAKKVHRVLGECKLDTNLADYVNELFDMKAEDTGLKSIPLKFTAQIEFDLDQVTKKTLQSNATSEGGFQIILTAYPNDPVEEETFKGKTQLRILNTTVVKQPVKGKGTR